MEEETIGMVAWNRFAKLLQGPGRRWMCGDVAMHDAPCSNLHQEEHIESSEPGGHYDQEIAGDDGLGVIANKRPPVLRRSPPVALSLWFRRAMAKASFQSQRRDLRMRQTRAESFNRLGWACLSS